MQYMGYTSVIMITVPLILHCALTLSSVLNEEEQLSEAGSEQTRTIIGLQLGLMLNHCLRR